MGQLMVSLAEPIAHEGGAESTGRRTRMSSLAQTASPINRAQYLNTSAHEFKSKTKCIHGNTNMMHLKLQSSPPSAWPACYPFWSGPVCSPERSATFRRIFSPVAEGRRKYPYFSPIDRHQAAH